MSCRQEHQLAKRGFWPLLLLAAGWCLVDGPACLNGQTNRVAGSTARQVSSDQFFTNGAIPNLKIEINRTNLATLQRNSRAYVRATVRDGDTVYDEVAIHVKGAAGSLRDVNDKPALTINFDRYQDRQRFHGLDKIHLNNSVQDPSYLTELLCGDLFRAAGVPAARTTHARVELNGRDLGLYVLKEGFNKTFLRQYFKNPNGNLFDGGFLREISEPLQRMSGAETNGHAPLKALVAAAMEPDPAKRMERLEQVLDVDRFLSFIAMEVMTWHWDGYAMKRNNYRVYHDPETDKAVFFPHGMDQMFWEPNGPILPANPEGLVARSLLQTTAGRRRYRERVGTLLTNVFRVESLTNRINEVQARIRPVLAAINPEAARNHDASVIHLRNEIVQRAASIERQLSLPEPKPLRFDASGRAVLTAWREHNPQGNDVLDKVPDAARPETLHIRVGTAGHCVAGWRTRVLLAAGQYRFEGEVRTAGVLPLKDQKGEGVGLRISGSQIPRLDQVAGDSAWQKVGYDFAVPADGAEVDLVCELRAVKGEAWFDPASLLLVRKNQ